MAYVHNFELEKFQLQIRVARLSDEKVRLLEKIDDEGQSHASELAQARADSLKMSQDLDAYQKEKSSWEKREVELTDRLESVGADNKALREGNMALQEDNTYLRQVTRALQEQISALREMFKNLKKENASLSARLSDQEQRADRLAPEVAQLSIQERGADCLELELKALSSEEQKRQCGMLILSHVRYVEAITVQTLWPGVQSKSCLTNLSSCIEFLMWFRDQPVITHTVLSQAPSRHVGTCLEFLRLPEKKCCEVFRRLDTLLSHQKFQRLHRVFARVTGELGCYVSDAGFWNPRDIASFLDQQGTSFIREHFPELEGHLQLIQEYKKEGLL